jgi:1,2-phenylacetyl-CoA epoxidase catalytic subunit
MGDEATSMHPDPSRSRTSGSRGESQQRKLDRFWKAMLEMFGTRWTTAYGQTPSELWTLAVESLTAKELRTAYRALLASASPHPPTLPEFVAFARQDSGKKASRFPQPFSPEWNEMRKTVMAAIAKQTRERGVEFTAEQRAASDAAIALA